MKAKFFFLALCSFSYLNIDTALAQTDYDSDALKRHQDEQMIAEYEEYEKRQAQKRQVDKTLPIDFDQVETVWQRHAQRRPYNGTITSSLPLDPAYSSAFSPKKEKVVQRPRNYKVSTKKKSTKKATDSTKTMPTQEKEGVSNVNTNVRISGPTTNKQFSNVQPNSSQTPENENLKTLTTIDSANPLNGSDYNTSQVKDDDLKILRTSDNTIEALESLLKDNPKLQEEITRLRLNQEASVKDELNLPNPDYIEIVN